MKCPKCKVRAKLFHTHTFYDANGYTRTMRRYYCDDCRIRFTTNETLAEESISDITASYKTCYTTAEYDGQDCSKCPYLKECGGA